MRFQLAAGGGLQCNAVAVTAFDTLLITAGSCEQQDAADAMIDLAKKLKNNAAMIKLAQVFVQQPRNTVSLALLLPAILFSASLSAAPIPGLRQPVFAPKTEAPAPQSVENFDDLPPAVKAARMGMFGHLTRTQATFYPNKLVCKRFGVQNPHPEGKDDRGDDAGVRADRPGFGTMHLQADIS